MRTLWGRCWEAGGAPAYWPWVQILRAVLRTAEPGQFDAFLSPLSQVLPELRESHGTHEASDLGAEQARFQLMDGVGHVLGNVAERCPILLILEDLHVADVSTVLLLDFLIASVRNQPIIIVGTYRDADLASSTSGTQLLRTARQGHQLPLDRLSTFDIEAFLRSTDGHAEADANLVEALYQITEGHPLFLVEVGRLWRSQGARDRDGRPLIPNSVRQATHERIDRLGPECVRVLQRGAVVGREFEATLLDTNHPKEPSRCASACQEATEATILIEIGPQRYRFAHYLIRELIYESIPLAERLEEHRRLAETLVRRHAGSLEPEWSEVAHHFSLAGPDAVNQAADAYLRASRQALEQLAFDEAISAAQSALDAAESAMHADASLRATILIQRGHAQTRSGDIASGKASCTQAASIAREIGDADLLARAALEHGTALIFAEVDPELVALLEEAVALLDPTDSAMRARVMARLAAALQPALDTQVPMDLAHEAIQMARRVGDRAVLLDTLRNGGSALVDLADPEERLALDREHAALAEELANPREALLANVRSFMDFVQLGRLDDAYRVIHACELAAEELRHPAYRWRCVALHGLRALWEGNFEAATEYIDELGSLATRSKDPNAQRAYEHQRVRLFQLTGDFDNHQLVVAAIERSWRGSDFGGATADVLAGAEHMIAGRSEQALHHFHPEGIDLLIKSGDPSAGLSMARLCFIAGNQELAERLLTRLILSSEQLVTTGMIGMTIEGPHSWSLALLNRALGRFDDSAEHYEHAMTKARRTGGKPTLALIAGEYAEMLIANGAPEQRHRAAELARLSISTAEPLGMTHWVTRIAEIADVESVPASPASSTHATVPGLTIGRVGDAWSLSYEGQEFHLKDMKGVRLLAALIENPGREFHVLDLGEGSQARAQPVDRGDAGVVLDETSRRQYRDRVAALQEELEEAESWNDVGRAQKLHEELDFLKRELANALGLGGRNRRAGAAAERARVNIQRRIRDAIRRIEAHHPRLAKHLQQSIKTGAYCSYDP